MIRGLVDFALNDRWMVLGLAVMLFAWGIVSFHDLPVEAYPDVANNYVQVITQWPGRAAEEVEQQVTKLVSYGLLINSQESLGHSSYQMTTEAYSHAVHALRNEAIDSWCPEGDLNPHDRLGSADFKSAVSADFTIRAGHGLVRCHPYLIS